MVAVTAAVWLRLYVERIGEMRARAIAPQRLATAKEGARLLERVGAADNFRNLFEVPVLLYALCLGLAVTQTVTPLFVTGAWVYVALRALHSLIHVTYNRVMHRFTVYAVSTVLLFLLWGLFAARLLGIGWRSG